MIIVKTWNISANLFSICLPHHPECIPVGSPSTAAISTGQILVWKCLTFTTISPPPQPFYGPFSGTTRVSRCQKRTSGLTVQGEINRGRHTDHPAGRHSIWTNQYPLPSNRHHRSCGDRLEGKGENYQICSVQYCVQQLCTVHCTHIWTDKQFSGLGFVSLGPFHCA